MGGKARTVFGAVLALVALYASGGTAAPWLAGYAGYLQAATIAYGAWAAREARQKAMNAQQAALQDRKIMLRGATVPKAYVYGRAWISGVITFWREPKSKADPYAWLVLTLPIAHRISGIDQIWFGDTQVTPLSEFNESSDAAFYRVKRETASVDVTVPANRTITIPSEGRRNFRLLRVADKFGVTVVYNEGSEGFEGVPVSGGDGYTAPAVPVGSVLGDTRIYLDALVGYSVRVTYSYEFSVRHIMAWRYLGLPDQVANEDLIAATAAEIPDFRWTASDRLQGVPYIILRLLVDPDVFPHDLENVTVLVRGKDDILDPRDGQSRYTENSMLCARDYAIAQCDVLASEINATRFNAEVNACDELIYSPDPNTGLPVTTARFRTHVVLSTEVEPINNLGILLSACDGSAVTSGATFDLRCGRYEEPTLVLTDSDLAGAPQIVKGPERPDLFNGVRARYLNSAKPFWPMEDCPAFLSPFYTAKDGGRVRTREIDLPATIEAAAALRLVKQMLHRERAGLMVQAIFNTKGLQLSPEQTVYLSLRCLGMDEKPFRIKSMKPVGLHQVELAMIEDGPLLYQWSFDESAGVDPAPNSNLPSVRDVPLVEGLNADTSLAAAAFGPEGELTSQCRVYWLPVTDMLVLNGGHIEVRHKRSFDAKFSESPYLSPTQEEYRFPCKRGDELLIEVRLANALVRGPWKQLNKVADDSPAQYLVAGNLLVNASLVWTSPYPTSVYPHWSAYRNGDLVANTLLIPGMASPLPIDMQSNIASMSTTSAAAGEVLAALSDRISVAANQRMLIHASLEWGGGDAFIFATFYNSSNQLVGYLSTDYVPVQPYGQGLLKRPPLFAFGTSPPGTAYATVAWGVRAKVAGILVVFCYHPYFGIAAEGQVTLPPWNAGD